MPTLFLPHRFYLTVVKGFSYTTALLEKYILGLTYEVRGQEYLPESGSYIIAAKHQSVYETFKLHILFNNPAVVLKKELLKIPLWGRYLAKSDVIAIDRSSPKTAIKSIKEGAKRVAAQGRPIIIFPQGTRVSPKTSTKEKPYKIGIVRMQEATNLPIIPMALNTGVFYPKGSWCKKPGRVVFEFLSPVNPSDSPSDVLKQIEMKLEEKSSRLADEGEKTIPAQKSYNFFAIAAIILFIAYSINWFVAASITKKAVTSSLEQLKNNPQITDYKIPEPKIYGFPGKMKLVLSDLFIKTVNGRVSIEIIRAKSWPMEGMPVDIRADNITFLGQYWRQSIDFKSFDAQVVFENNILTISDSSLKLLEAQGQVRGSIDFGSSPYPIIDLDLNLINFTSLIKIMAEKNIIRANAAAAVSLAFQALEKDGVITTSITSDNNKIYLGPLKIMEFPPVRSIAR